MEEDVSGATSFSVIEEAPQSELGKWLDEVCPFFMMCGMSWQEFWYGSLDRFAAYYQKYQYERERRNEELWVQGIYVMEAVSAVLDSKRRCKYPDKPHRITEMTEAEKEAENRRKVEQMREMLIEHKRRWDAKRQGS